MPTPDPLKNYRVYIAMFLLNLAVVIGVIYLLRRENPRPVAVTLPPRASKTATTRITVGFSGAVKRPGSYQLDDQARLSDVLQQAGGVNSNADLSQMNLTRPLANGEQIVIPTIAPVANHSAPPSAITPVATQLGKLNLNTATFDELDALPGIGPTLAQRILDYRKQVGGFKSVAEIKQVRGIGDTLYEELKEMIFVQ